MAIAEKILQYNWLVSHKGRRKYSEYKHLCAIWDQIFSHYFSQKNDKKPKNIRFRIFGPHTRPLKLSRPQIKAKMESDRIVPKVKSYYQTQFKNRSS